jgi:pimeloyl-ACP methyl ester carboxylesterase
MSGYLETASQPILRARRTILIDFLEFGCSDRPQGFGYTVEEQATSVAALLDALGIKRAVLVGHSMGGSVAILLATQRPALVARLIVVEPPLELGEESASRIIAEQDEAAFIAEGFDIFLDALRREASSNATLAVFAGMFQLAAPHAVHRTARSIVVNTPTLFGQLAQFTGPKAYVWGSDTVAEPHAAATRTRLIGAGVPCPLVAKSGHHPNLDNPNGFATAIAEILR